MKTLCIVRHAKTEVQMQGQRDFDRRLAPRAYNDVPAVCKQLKSLKVSPDAIVSSPAIRAISTAGLLAEKLNFDQEQIIQNAVIYDASLNTLVKVVKAFDDNFDTVFLLGHNPGLTLLANFFCLPPILHIPTSGVVCIDFEIAQWKSVSGIGGKQRFFIQA